MKKNRAGGDRFVGAYRYDGYSLFDILDKKILKKSNSNLYRIFAAADFFSDRAIKSVSEIHLSNE